MLKSLLAASALCAVASGALAATYTVTVTNNMDKELLAPILITNVTNDGHIFMGDYVTPEAEEQILTGDPAKLAARIGPDAMIGQGMDGPPGVLLAPGKSVMFDIMTDAASVRIISMIAPTLVPDNYVTAVIDLGGVASAGGHLVRYDIGHDEMTKVTTRVTGDAMMAEDDAMMSEDDTMAEDTMVSGDDTMASDTMASDDDTMMTEDDDMMAAAGVTISFVLK